MGRVRCAVVNPKGATRTPAAPTCHPDSGSVGDQPGRREAAGANRIAAAGRRGPVDGRDTWPAARRAPSGKWRETLAAVVRATR
jgi:hypothetical protein